jgi:hypothetical protein
MDDVRSILNLKTKPICKSRDTRKNKKNQAKGGMALRALMTNP